MKYLPYRFLGLVACVFLSACASTGTTTPPNPAVVSKLNSINKKTMATVVIYRLNDSFGGWLRPTVMLNGKDLVNVGNGVVFVGAFRPGHYAIEMDDRKSGTEVDLVPGKAVYMKMEMVAGFWKGGGRLIQMAPEQGAFEAQRLQLIPPNEIENPAYR